MHQQSFQFKLTSPLLTSSNYSQAAVFHIPISIKSSSGFVYKTTLINGNNTITLPVETSLEVKVGYLALGLKANQTLTDFCNNENGPNEILYTETKQNLYILSSADSIEIAFENPLNVYPFAHLGFKLRDSAMNPVANAIAYFEDTTSEQQIYDPCKGQPLKFQADAGGRFPIDLPVYSSDGSIRFKIVDSNGNSQVFAPTLVNQSQSAQFFYLQMGTGNVTAMNTSTESFLDDEYSIDSAIAQNRNPRFQNIASYTYNAPSTNAVNYGEVDFFSSVTNGSVLQNRSINIMCQVVLATTGGRGSVVVPYQICQRHIPNVLTYFPNLTIGSYYFLDVYLIDTEGYLVSDKTAAYPATTIQQSTPFPYSFNYPAP